MWEYSCTLHLHWVCRAQPPTAPMQQNCHLPTIYTLKPSKMKPFTMNLLIFGICLLSTHKTGE